jgi:hypothetical protein
VAVAAVAATVVLVAVFAVAAFLFVVKTPRPRAPRPAADPAASRDFNAANEALVGFDGEHAAFGNTAEARGLAERLSRKLETLRAVAFTGGRDPGAPSLTQGRFLTYCELREGSVCFLVHVPELRNYEDKARETLWRMAWAAATQTVEDLPEARRSRLAVGLRGVLLFDVVMVGASDGSPPARSDDSDVLHAFFSGPEPEASPVPAAPSPVPSPSPTPPLTVAERLKQDLEAIGLEDFERRTAAEKDLRELGPAAVPDMIRTLKDTKRPVNARCTGMFVLATSGEPRAATILLEQLDDPDAGHCAQEGLKSRAAGDPSILPALVRGLEQRCVKAPRGEDPRRTAFCGNSLRAIGHYGGGGAVAAPVLPRIMRAHAAPEEYHLRSAAATTAGLIGPAAKDVVPLLIEDLASTNTYVVQEALKALGRMGPDAAAALPVLLTRKFEEGNLTSEAEAAVAAIRGTASVPAND